MTVRLLVFPPQLFCSPNSVLTKMALHPSPYYLPDRASCHLFTSLIEKKVFFIEVLLILIPTNMYKLLKNVPFRSAADITAVQQQQQHKDLHLFPRFNYHKSFFHKISYTAIHDPIRRILLTHGNLDFHEKFTMSDNHLDGCVNKLNSLKIKKWDRKLSFVAPTSHIAKITMEFLKYLFP